MCTLFFSSGRTQKSNCSESHVNRFPIQINKNYSSIKNQLLADCRASAPTKVKLLMLFCSIFFSFYTLTTIEIRTKEMRKTEKKKR